MNVVCATGVLKVFSTNVIGHASWKQFYVMLLNV